MHHSTKGHSKGDQQHHNKHHLRQEKDCLNCGHTVESRFCSYCGQENTEKRQSFGHLVTHFIEDLTHYEGSFWKTIRYLLFRPALLTKAYLAGKRASFVAPVKLYIFVSFVCFFLPAVLPDAYEETADTAEHAAAAVPETDTSKSHSTKFRTDVFWTVFSIHGLKSDFKRPNDYTSVAQMDSMQAALPKAERYNWLEYRMAKRIIAIYSHYTEEEVSEKFDESFDHNIPKALFVYMPFCALMLWFFHGKKRWYYFDHAIFTLHYFSFMMLVFSIYTVLSFIGDMLPIPEKANAYLTVLYVLTGLIWVFNYFFRAHRKMYGESWLVSGLKCFVMFIINITFVGFLFVVFYNITLFSLH